MAATYYHVCRGKWDGDDLCSLFSQYNDNPAGWDAAYEEWCKHWPDAEPLFSTHAALIHLCDTLEMAQQHVGCIHGGRILRVTINDDWAEDNIYIDDEDYPHPVCTQNIPYQCVTPMPSKAVKKVAKKCRIPSAEARQRIADTCATRWAAQKALTVSC